MKVLFIGGTGNISTAVSRLAIERGIELFLLNRGKTIASIPGAQSITGDITGPGIAATLKDHRWDCVVNWIAYHEDDIHRDFELFRNTTKQYIFISSASCYQRPARHPIVTESTPLCNPYWQYSRNKIACEERLLSYHREHDFPVTIVRPSHTYDNVIPIPIGGWRDFTTADRIRRGRKIIVHGDGSSLWTLTHSEDFAKGFSGLIGHRQSIGHAFHITSDEILTWDQIHQTLAETLGCEARIVHIPSDMLAAVDDRLTGELIGDKVTSVIFDNTKIKRFVPEFTATIPFAQGIKRTIDWFEADAARQMIRQETNDWMDQTIARVERAFSR
ncbi:MAG TPA: NAD-dependent epimerase/dehydratase family protein [Bacteroidota bacterium]|nr:NAD-dependent epimerase/dehydratase family protein [Bacteroidota bacterium]